jgi:hypothetical protein
MLGKPCAFFVAPEALQVLFGPGTAVSQPIGGGLLLGLTPSGPFSCGSQVYDSFHSKPQWLSDRFRGHQADTRSSGQSSTTINRHGHEVVTGIG